MSLGSSKVNWRYCLSHQYGDARSVTPGFKMNLIFFITISMPRDVTHITIPVRSKPTLGISLSTYLMLSLIAVLPRG